MKRIIILFVLIGFLLAGEYKLVDQVLAVVGDEVITLSDVKNYEKELYKFLSQKYKGQELEEKFAQQRKKILNNLIQKKLLLIKAKEEGINVDQDLQLTMKNMAKEYGFSTVEELEKAMADQGINIEEWKKVAKENLMQQRLIQKEVDIKLSVTQGEIRSYYESHKGEFSSPARWSLRAIKVNKGEGAGKKKREIDRVLESKGFDEAVRLSDPPFNSNNGELGELSAREIRPEFLKFIKNTPAGKLTPWIEAEDGFYRFLVEKYSPPAVKPLSQVRKEIEQRILEEKRAQALKKFIEKLKKEIPVKILRPYP